MAKHIDPNGFWTIEGNPVTKEGVFPYTGSQIDSDGTYGLEPNKLYNVYRPASELTNPDTLKSLNGIPFIDEHTMIGEGCTKYDDRPAGGILFNSRPAESGGGTVVGDFRIFSEDLMDSIEEGKKELSLGYYCKYKPTRGIFDGLPYDFVQTGIIGNHIALVEKGRMGSSVRVYDSRQMVFDSMEVVKPANKGTDTMTDEENAKKEAEEKAASEAKAKEAADQKAMDDAAEAEKKAAEEAEAKKKADAEQAAKDCAKDAEAKEEESKKAAMDSAIKAAVIQLSERDELVKQVLPLVGAFDTAAMTCAEDVAVYACSKLKLEAPKGSAKVLLTGYLAGRSGQEKQFAMDTAPKSGKDAVIEKYLAGK